MYSTCDPAADDVTISCSETGNNIFIALFVLKYCYPSSTGRKDCYCQALSMLTNHCNVFTCCIALCRPTYAFRLPEELYMTLDNEMYG